MLRFATVVIGVTIALVGAVGFGVRAAEPAISGQILDLESGLPLAHVSVLIGTTLVAGPGVPAELPRDVVSTTTSADGTFAFATFPRARRVYVEVLPSDGHFPLHAQLALRDALRVTYRLSRPTEQEAAWLRVLNAERAAAGAGPVAFDEHAQETARYRAREMATSGVFEHRDAFDYYEGRGGVYPPGPSSAAENIGVAESPSSWIVIQRAFMLSVEHHRAIVDPRAVWAGVGLADGGKPPATWAGPVDYYAEVFVNGP
jgi:uncharacterized protein YkwD